MESKTIELAGLDHEYAREQAAAAGLNAADDYVRQLIHEDRKEKELARLEALVIEGMDSGEPVPVTEEWWDELNEELQRRFASDMTQGGLASL